MTAYDRPKPRLQPPAFSKPMLPPVGQALLAARNGVRMRDGGHRARCRKAKPRRVLEQVHALAADIGQLVEITTDLAAGSRAIKAAVAVGLE
ncbi:hypothetical protein [Actinoplanes sp. M2I2]|uniref:hypothetical protein n=1 Tax=Actinoplanes sp. M2I2 TaxID=1734444 RepID=UPI0020220BBB|nr:hypothetical protein [Actinoplanes sp. M2I2]